MPAHEGFSPLIALPALRERSATEPVRLIQVGREPDGDIPLVAGAIRLSIADFAGEEGPRTGRLPLPDHEAFVARLVAWGIAPETSVALVAETGQDLAAVARGWVTIRWNGASNVSVLDGAFAETDADELATLVSAPPRSVSASEFVIDSSVVIDAEAIADPTVLAIDARSVEVFTEPGPDGAPQHLPHAANLPSSLVASQGVFRDPDTIRAAFLDVSEAGGGATVPATYCGSGIAASVLSLGLASAGIHAPVYVGSWTEWAKTHESTEQSA